MKNLVLLDIFPDSLEGLFGTAAVLITVVLLAVWLIISALFSMTLYFCFMEIAPGNRKIHPGLSWLLMIPFVSIVANFFVIPKLADSLALEYNRRSIPLTQQRPTFNIGIAYAACSVAGFMPLIGGLIRLAGIVCFIIYWVQVADARRTLRQHPVTESSDGDLLAGF